MMVRIAVPLPVLMKVHRSGPYGHLPIVYNFPVIIKRLVTSCRRCVSSAKLGLGLTRG